MGAISFSLDEGLLQFFCEALQPTTFVETGTFQGDTLERAASRFKVSHSVEWSPALFEKAKQRFANRPSIFLHQGSSPEFLKASQKELAAEPVFFWLDAHWCAAQDTAGEDSQSPLLEEIRAISSLHENSVVLIDDARLYIAPPPKPHRVGDWPDFHDITTALLELSSAHRLMIWNDVIVFYPEKLKGAFTAYAAEHGVDWLAISNHAKSWSKRKARPWWQRPFRS